MVSTRRLTVSQRTRKVLAVLCGYSSQVPLIGLVAHKHDDDVAVRMVPQLLQPPRDVLEREALADVVDEERTDGAPVVGRSDGAVPLLTRSIPNLSLDRLVVDLDGPCGELDADGRLGV